MPSSDILFLAPSLPPHILPHSSCSPFYFRPFCSVLSPSCFVWLPTPCFVSFSFFLYFLLFGPFLVIIGFPISCVLTTSPHFPSSDPSGPETPSFWVHRPLPPPEVLTPQHTALCAAVHILGLIAKACLAPFGGALVSVWGGFEMWLVAKDQASLPPRGGGGILHLSFKLKKKNSGDQ